MSPDDEAGGPSAKPEFEVWNHLESGWQMAYDDMARKVSPAETRALESVAASVFDVKQSLLHEDIAELPAGLVDSFSFLDGPVLKLFLTAVAERYPDVPPMLRHAIELEVASAGIRRARTALERFKSLVHVVLSQPVPSKVRPYLKELAHTYLFGFDAAAIALARSTFEQFARSVLVAKGVYTEPQIRRERPTAGTLLAKLRQAGCLERSFDAASRLVSRGDTVLHGGIYEERVLGTLALDSIREIQEAAQDLAAHL